MAKTLGESSLACGKGISVQPIQRGAAISTLNLDRKRDGRDCLKWLDTIAGFLAAIGD